MICRVPVFRCDFDGKWEVEKSVDDGDDIAAVRNSKRSVLIVKWLVWNCRRD